MATITAIATTAPKQAFLSTNVRALPSNTFIVIIIISRTEMILIQLTVTLHCDITVWERSVQYLSQEVWVR